MESLADIICQLPLCTVAMCDHIKVVMNTGYLKDDSVTESPCLEQGNLVRAAALAGDVWTAHRLCMLYSDPRYAVHSHGGRTFGGVFFDIRGASYIVAVAEPEGCSLGECTRIRTSN